VTSNETAQKCERERDLWRLNYHSFHEKAFEGPTPEFSEEQELEKTIMEAEDELEKTRSFREYLSSMAT